MNSERSLKRPGEFSDPPASKRSRSSLLGDLASSVVTGVSHLLVVALDPLTYLRPMEQQNSETVTSPRDPDVEEEIGRANKDQFLSLDDIAALSITDEDVLPAPPVYVPPPRSTARRRAQSLFLPEKSMGSSIIDVESYTPSRLRFQHIPVANETEAAFLDAYARNWGLFDAAPETNQLHSLRTLASQHRKDTINGFKELRFQREAEKEWLRKLREAERADEFKKIHLTEEQNQAIRNAMSGRDYDEICDEFNILVTREDIRRLSPGKWLGDVVVNYYMELLNERSKTNPSLPKIFCFNSFFYTKLQNSGYSAVQRWTRARKLDIFALERVVVPVHLGMHWCLAVIDIGKRQFQYFDSMGGRNPECLRLLRNYVKAEHEFYKKAPINLDNWVDYAPGREVPQQMNGNDCGVFMCRFAERVASDIDFNFSQDDMPLMRKLLILDILNRTVT